MLLQEDMHCQAQLAQADCGALGAVCIVTRSAWCPREQPPMPTLPGTCEQPGELR